MASDCWGAQLNSLEMVSTGMLPSRHSTQVAHCLFHLNQDISKLVLGRTTGCVLRTSCWSCGTTQGCTGIDHIKWAKLSVIHTSEAHQSHTGARHSRLSLDGMGWNVISVMHDDKIWQDWTLWKTYPSCLSVSATWFQVEVAYSFLQHLSRDAKAAHPFTKQTLYRRLLLDETSSVRARWIEKVQVKVILKWCWTTCGAIGRRRRVPAACHVPSCLCDKKLPISAVTSSWAAIFGGLGGSACQMSTSSPEERCFCVSMAPMFSKNCRTHVC